MVLNVTNDRKDVTNAGFRSASAVNLVLISQNRSIKNIKKDVSEQIALCFFRH